jgi:hypothetical protein
MTIFNRQVQQCKFTIYQREIILFVGRMFIRCSKMDVYTILYNCFLRKNSWISWPLAFIVRNAGGSAREVESVSMR